MQRAVKPQVERRVALITGGCGGVGAAVCRRLAKDGLAIAALDRAGADVAALAATLPGSGHFGLHADVADETAAAEAFCAVEARLGAVDVLVTAAGVLILRPGGARNPVAETSLSEWQKTLDINMNGTFLFCREYARRVHTRREGGRIVTIGSVAAQLGGYRSSSAYIASKAAVMGFTKGLARELAPFGITANSVAPGLIDAPMLRLSLDPADDDKAAAAIPLGRIGAPEDVAGAVAYLVSPDASYVTGSVIDVNGGYHMQ